MRRSSPRALSSERAFLSPRRVSTLSPRPILPFPSKACTMRNSRLAFQATSNSQTLHATSRLELHLLHPSAGALIMPPMSLPVSGHENSPAPHHRPPPHGAPMQYVPSGYGHAQVFPPESSMIQGGDPNSQFVSKLKRYLHAGSPRPRRRSNTYETTKAFPHKPGGDQLPLHRRLANKACQPMRQSAK